CQVLIDEVPDRSKNLIDRVMAFLRTEQEYQASGDCGLEQQRQDGSSFPRAPVSEEAKQLVVLSERRIDARSREDEAVHRAQGGSHDDEVHDQAAIIAESQNHDLSRQGFV